MAISKRFPADHLGPLLPPPSLARQARSLQGQALHDALETALYELIRLQSDSWISLVTDGELRRQYLGGAVDVVAEAQAVVRQTEQAVKVRVPRAAASTQTLESLMELGVRYIQLDGAAYGPLLHQQTRAALTQQGTAVDEQLQALLTQDTTLLKALQRKPGVKLAMAFHDVTQASPQGFSEDLDETAAERVFQALTLDRFIFDAGPATAAGKPPRDYRFLRLLPDEVQAVLGLIDVSTRTLPDPDDLVREIDAAAKVIDTDRLALAPRHALTVASHLGTDEEAEAAWRYQGEVMELLLDASSRAWGIDF